MVLLSAPPSSPYVAAPRLENPDPSVARLGKYLLRGVIGQGATGIVHEALDPVIGRVVAIKRLRADAGDAAVASLLQHRFRREARAAGRLSHPHLVAVHDCGEHHGAPFIVMERVRGRPLSARLVPGRQRPWNEVVAWLVPLLEALDAAHRAGIVHRDVKPDNVFLPEEGGVKLGDFGAAALAPGPLDDAADADAESPGRRAVGTPHYASPEQLRGAPAAPAADLWSVGVLLFQALSGHRPYAGTLVGVVQQVLAGPAPSLRTAWPQAPEPLVRLVARALATDPLDRFPDAAAFRDAARAAAATWVASPPAVDDGPPGHPEPLPPSVRPSPPLASGGPSVDGACVRRRREAATRLHALQRAAAEARSAADAAQYARADGLLLVEGPGAARRGLETARRLEEAAEAVEALLGSGEAPARDDALDVPSRTGAREAARLAREQAVVQRIQADDLVRAVQAAQSDVTAHLDRLDERLCVLEAYGAHDAHVAAGLAEAPPGAAGAPGPAEVLGRRLERLDEARRQCERLLQRLEAGPRLPASCRARAAAAGLRLAALGRQSAWVRQVAVRAACESRATQERVTGRRPSRHSSRA